jgi:hypothetical protein
MGSPMLFFVMWPYMAAVAWVSLFTHPLPLHPLDRRSPLYDRQD